MKATRACWMGVGFAACVTAMWLWFATGNNPRGVETAPDEFRPPAAVPDRTGSTAVGPAPGAGNDRPGSGQDGQGAQSVLGEVRDDAEATRRVRAWYSLGREAPVRTAAISQLPPSLLGGLQPGELLRLPWPGGPAVEGRVRTALREPGGLEILAGRLISPREGFFHLERKGDIVQGRLGFAGARTVAVIFPIGAGWHAFVEQRREFAECTGAARDVRDLLGGVFSAGVFEVIPNLDPWKLESQPGAPGVLFLDFDGHTVQNTAWNTEYTDGDPIVVAKYQEFDTASPKYRPEWIFDVFNRCKEDFAPFKLNVTTSQAVFDAAPSGRRQRILITPTSGWYPEDAGGVAYGTTFTFNSDTPCWVWNGGIQWSMPETVSHEAGHTLGLSHSSHDTTNTPFDEYYDGHGLWAPIMGNSFSGERPYTQWDNGFFKGAVNFEDQIAIIAATGSGTNNVGFRNDDRGNTQGSATTVSANAGGVIHTSGRLEQNGDIDVYRFSMPAGTFDILGESHDPGPNAYLKLSLRNNSFGLIKTTTTPSGQPAHTTHAAAQAATYYLEVTNSGRTASGSDQGFPAYGAIGNYRLEITEPGGDDERPVVSALLVGPLVFGHEYLEVVAIITDNKAVRMDTLNTGDLVVTKGASSWTPAIVSAAADPDLGSQKIRVTFHWSPPGGFWDTGDAGTYSITFKSASVGDTNNNLNIGSSSTSLVVPSADTKLAKITAPSPWPTTVMDGTSYSFALKFEDPDTAFVLDSFDAGDVEVEAPDGSLLPVSLVSKSAANFNREVTATYQVVPPGGSWDEDDVGTYSVKVAGGQVLESGGVSVAGTDLGGFPHRVVLFSRNMTINPGFVLGAGWEWGIPTGDGGFPSGSGPDPASGHTGPRVLGTNLSGNYATNAVVTRATSPVISTAGYQKLLLSFWDWRNINDPVEVDYRIGAGAWKSILSDDFGLSEEWQEVVIPLPTECDNQPQVQFRWSLGPTGASGNLRPSSGWNIDDIQLLAGEAFGPGRVSLFWFPLGRFSLTEGGTKSYSVRLDQDPGAGTPVTITLSAGRGGSSLIDHPASVVLDSTNWQTGKTITVSGTENNRVDGTRSTTLRHTVASANPHFSGIVGPSLTVNVLDDESPLIDRQPADRELPVGASAGLKVTPLPVTGTLSYQWYSGDSGDTDRPINRATTPELVVTVGSATSRYWVRVTRTFGIFSTVTQDSRTASVSPLSGYAAWKHALLSHGYSQSQLDAPEFDGADPESDGLGHLLEYALGGQPYTLDAALLPRLVMMSDGPHLFFRRAQADLDYTVQVVQDPLDAWADFATNPGGVDPGADQHVLLPASGHPVLLARLRVSQ